VQRSELPAEFIAQLEALASSYLAQSDPYLQSGFGGGTARWRAEREPILEAIQEQSADLLDVGCANGLLLESLVEWAAPGRYITPFGVDQSAGLIASARRRLPRYAANFFVANAWSWCPPRRFAYVYALSDCVPTDYLQEFIRHLLDHYVQPGGRLILGSYGSRSRGTPPLDPVALLAEAGLPAAGTASGGQNRIARFAWTDKEKPHALARSGCVRSADP
jgi:SAM-dependent methyltransferase